MLLHIFIGVSIVISHADCLSSRTVAGRVQGVWGKRAPATKRKMVSACTYDMLTMWGCPRPFMPFSHIVGWHKDMLPFYSDVSVYIRLAILWIESKRSQKIDICEPFNEFTKINSRETVIFYSNLICVKFFILKTSYVHTTFWGKSITIGAPEKFYTCAPGTVATVLLSSRRANANHKENKHTTRTHTHTG